MTFSKKGFIRPLPKRGSLTARLWLKITKERAFKGVLCLKSLMDVFQGKLPFKCHT